MTVRISLGAVLTALFFAAVGAGGAVGVMLWEPWEGDNGSTEQAVPVPQPTPDEPRLTKQEAVGLVAASCPVAAIGFAINNDATALYIGDGKWTVRFQDHRWTVDETTITVIPLAGNAITFRCAPSQ